MRHILKLKLSIFQEMSEKLKLTFLQGFQDDCCRFSHVQIVSNLGSSVLSDRRILVLMNNL